MFHCSTDSVTQPLCSFYYAFVIPDVRGFQSQVARNTGSYTVKKRQRFCYLSSES
jgi:hypothetical protein